MGGGSILIASAADEELVSGTGRRGEGVAALEEAQRASARIGWDSNTDTT